MYRYYEANEPIADVFHVDSAFTSGTTKTTDAGFEHVRVNSFIHTKVSSTDALYLVTAIDPETKVITGLTLTLA